MPAEATSLQIQPYEGPRCPRCDKRLMADWIRTGIVRCPDCNGDFEATAFQPPSRQLQVAQVLAMGPIEANVCANHAQNAAVTACQRCGLLICALCDMNVGAGSYCPACFDRLRSENALQGAATRFRDYASMARVSVIAGFLLMFAGVLFGPLSLYYAAKGFKQLRAEGRSIVGLVIVVVFAVLETLGGLAFILLMIVGLAKGMK